MLLTGCQCQRDVMNRRKKDTLNAKRPIRGGMLLSALLTIFLTEECLLYIESLEVPNARIGLDS